MEEKSITPEGIINQAMDLNLSFAGAEFPVGIFPSQIQHIIHEVYECQSYPIDYTAGYPTDGLFQADRYKGSEPNE